jgi:hypothetical protein
MKQCLLELRKIMQMPDQKHWQSTKMREHALEEWIETWVIECESELSVLNQRFMESEFEDFLKEQVGKKLFDQVMVESVGISKDNTKIKGNIACLRRKPKN